MAPGDGFDFGGERVVVGVSKDPSCKDAIKWAIANKVRSPDDILILLHVVTKIPSPRAVEMYQSEVNNTMFVHYVRTVVQPMMLSLKKVVDPKIKLELKVGRNNSREKGIVEESSKLKATTLVLGTNARGMFSMRGKSSSTGAYCVRYKPHGLSVFVIQKDKVVLFKESEGSPLSSASGSPAGSGRLMAGSGGSGQGSGALEPTYSGGFNEPGGGSGEYDESGGGGYGGGYGQYQQYPTRGGAPQGGGWGGGGMNAPYGEMGGHGGMMGGMRGVASRGQYGSNDSSPQGSGAMQPYMPASGGGGSGSLQSRFSMDGGSMDSSPGGGPKGGNDIQQAATLSALAWSKQAANTAEGQKLQSDYLAEFDAWKRANQAATFQQQQDFMVDLQSRMTKARAALAGLQLGEGGGGGSSAGGEAGGDGGGGGGMQHSYPAAIPAPVPAASDAAAAGSGGGVENDLRRELEMMRQRAAEAEKARLEAEQRAQRALSEADRSLREVEAQNKRRELETAVRIEMASQEAARAMAAAEEARKQAELEAQKTEVAMKQAAMTRAALELEEKRRQEAEKKAKADKGGMRMMANYREYSYDDIVFATENFKADRKLGEGGFGTVFSGTLHHTPVAVKVLKNTDAMQAAHEFQQEVEVLSQIQHPHVVMLLGCCPDRYCLVYEFMANGSLEDRLLCANNTPPLPWYIRMRVAAEIASALLILHTRPVPIVHRDLKPGNILLDKNFVAKLGDVGLAKLMPGLSMDQTYMRESVPVGTFAYVDPEFQRTGEFGPKSDVYALGIVLLDLLTGRKPNVYEGLEEAVDDGDEEAMREYLDERAGNWPLDIVMEVAKIAVKCSEMRRKKRPDLETHVMPVLDRARARAVQAEEEARKAPVKRSIGDAPSSLFCPITQEMMVTPVLAADGHTYEKEAIESWLERSDRSPMTNEQLPSKDLVPNHAVRAMISDWRERNL
ncbi:hypothetical protein CLOM_g1119 [Closterium sp. NIES-68]|nr:hypothetical protein CLOM_g1119 [Closterium sp. NIES-68]GJP62094.1 hypothetical protein CLOP_g19192 [Closterium sp. NIES-67]